MKILSASIFASALSAVPSSACGGRKPAIDLWIDFGPEFGERKSSAQLTLHYTPVALIGRHLAAVVNLGPKRIGAIPV